MASDSDLLKEIRDTFQDEVNNWKEIREEGRKDMLCVNGNPWDPNDRNERRGAGRLTLSFDEINQYCNQLINDVRQNKRAVKVLPRGLGATDQTAELRGGMIRNIEYDSKAQPAYRTAFEGVVQRSYGAWMYKTQYISDSSIDHELKIVRIPNPDVIYMDWEAKEADFSDGNHAFEIDSISRKKFKRDWPDATIQDFTNEYMREYPQWVKNDKTIQVAKFWKVTTIRDKLYVFPNGSTALLSDLETEKGKPKVHGNFLQFESGPIEFINWRKTEQRKIKLYITNGIEILEENDWPGKYIPIVFITGKELYVDEGHGPVRKLLSLVRLAREPLMAYCYLWTSQVEMAQMMPKVPLMGYKGQFDTDTEWDKLHKSLVAYAEFRGVTPESEKADRSKILPPPTRPSYSFDVQSIEVMKESARRAIQSSMGITGLLNGTNTNAEARSGVALRTMDQQESQGNFHFIDNYDLGVEYGGRIMDDLLDDVYDGEDREIGTRNLKGEHSVVKINQFHRDTDGNYILHAGQKQKVGFHTDLGEHGITITTGPSFESQRAEAQDFAESLTKMGDPEVLRAILPDIVQLRNLGPIGDEIVKKLQALDPTKQQVPPAIQGQLQRLTAIVQKQQQVIQSKQVEIQGRLQIEREKLAGKNWQVTQDQSVELQKTRMNNEAMIQQALVKLGDARMAEQVASALEAYIMAWEHQHEFDMQQDQQAHEMAMAQAAQQAARATGPSPGSPPSGPQTQPAAPTTPQPQA